MTYPPIWDFTKKGKAILEGTYVGQYPNIGRWRNVLYAIKSKEGKTYTIWGTREIKQALAMRDYGKKIRLQYLGKIRDKKHTSGIVHFQINVGRGKENPDLKNNRRHGKTARAVAARRTATRQYSATPLSTVGRGLAAASAAKNKKGKTEKRGRPRKLAIPLPPPGYNAFIPLPPPVRPVAPPEGEIITAAMLEKQKRGK
jgi:hypothetical protein